MNTKNRKKLWKKIIDTGDYLKNKLPESSFHPKGRNSYAHVALEVKNKFNISYKYIPDKKLEDVLKFLEYLKKNPS